MKLIALVRVAGVVCLIAISALAQLPTVNQGLIPASATPGTAQFSLIVNGTGFSSSAVVNWNGSPRSTKVISHSRLQATILASDVSAARTAKITVTNPGVGGGSSNVVYFPVMKKSKAIGMAISQPFAGATAITVGDFNNDGIPDVAWTDANGSGGLNISLGNGKGGFQAPIVAPSILAPIQIVTADFNNDGKVDVAAISHGEIYILLGNGDGTFALTYQLSSGLTLSGIAVADFNGDGKLDIYVAGEELGPYVFEIFTGNGDGTITLHATYNTGSYPTGYIPGIPAVGDFNQDGSLDLLIGGQPVNGGPVVTLWLGSATGDFIEYGTVAGANGSNFAAADVNHDGKLDVVADGGCVMLGNGNGTFGSCSYTAYPGAIDGFGDFNGDRNLDIVNASSEPSGSVVVQLGAGNGTFPTPFFFYGGVASPRPGAVADFNNDGLLDVVSPNGYLLLQTTVDLTPFSIAFGSQNVGTTSPAQIATLLNVGTAQLAITKISIAGANPSQFAQTNNCGTSLPPGASCAISVTFKPTKSAPLTGALNVSYKGTASPQTVALSGTGVAGH